MRILFVCEGETVPATRFRVQQYLPYFQQAGHQCTVRHGYGRRYNQWARGRLGKAYKAACALRKLGALRDARRFDLIFLQRSLLPFNAWAEAALAALRIPFVFDFDDAVHLGAGGVTSAARSKTLLDVAALATWTTPGNAYLAERARQPQKTTVIPTAIDTKRYVPAPLKSGPLVLGWIGTSHNLPFVRSIVPSLRRILDRYPHVSLRVVSNGHLSDLDDLPRTEQREWSAQREVADLQSFDIGLMPLFDNDLCRGKCAFKIIQYMATGIPLLASRVGANVETLGESNAGLLIAPGEGWDGPLQTLIEDAILRRDMGNRGRAWAVERYDAERVAQQYLSVFAEAVSRAMCGITGFWSAKQGDDDRGHAERMCASLLHRGPDAGGIWIDPAGGPALGHRRLSILDLSENGAQPMLSASGRFVITYNGEVYNLEELRAALRNVGRSSFRGHSDTELILAAVEAFGFESTLGKLSGMFAFALWDQTERRLHLAVDRLGKKPLYYGWASGTFYFASELKALVRHPDFDATLELEALLEFFRFGFIPAPRSIYAGVRKLSPGHALTLTAPDRGAERIEQYWSLERVTRAGRLEPFQGSDAEATSELERLLGSAVAKRMVADVPLGSLLSGGIDSSLVTALMQAQSSRPIKTFSIGYGDARFNEATHAKQVSAHLGTDHAELHTESGDALDLIPHLPQYYDEPFADASQLPTLLVSRLARKHVTVALTGDGGDEVWGGYDRYLWGRRLYDTFFKAPASLRQASADVLTRRSPEDYNRWFDTVERLVPAKYRVRLVGDKIHKLARIAGAATPEDYHLALASLAWSNPECLLRSARPYGSGTAQWPESIPGTDIAELMMLRDLAVVFPGDMLAKVDRASMAFSLECRIPFADDDVVAFAARLPLRFKIHEGQGKVLPRHVLDRYVPPHLMDRPKMGFGVPIADWLRGPLQGWAEDLLSQASLKEGELLDPTPIRKAWEEHLRGKRSRHVELWAVLMFQAWRREMPWNLANA